MLAVAPQPCFFPATRTRPEDELLLHCLRLSLGAGSSDPLDRLLRSGLDWDYLLRQAHRHGVTPLLHQALQSVDFGAAPPEARHRVQVQALRNAQWTLQLTAELLDLLDRLASRGLRAVPFKGPALSALLYGSVSLRQFDDLDLLIYREDFPAVREVLLSLGYRPKIPLSAEQERLCLKFYYHLEFVHQSRGVVELHWQVFRWHRLFPITPGLWERLEPGQLAGRQILRFSREDLILLSCLHGALHCWQRLLWLCDTAALLELPGAIDWDKLLKVAARFRAKRILLLGLYLAGELLGAAVPADLRQEAQADGRLISLVAAVGRNLCGDPGSVSALVSKIRFQLEVQEGWPARARFLLQAAFSPIDGDLAFLPLPPALGFLYCLVRPVRLLVQWLGLESGFGVTPAAD